MKKKVGGGMPSHKPESTYTWLQCDSVCLKTLGMHICCRSALCILWAVAVGTSYRVFSDLEIR